jgi:hypothetical protein
VRHDFQTADVSPKLGGWLSTVMFVAASNLKFVDEPDID